MESKKLEDTKKEEWVYIIHVAWEDHNGNTHEEFDKFTFGNEEKQINYLISEKCLSIKRHKENFSSLINVAYYQATNENTFNIDDVNKHLELLEKRRMFMQAKKIYLQLKKEFETE